MLTIINKPQFKLAIVAFHLLATLPLYAATLLLEENFNLSGNLNANGWGTHSATGTNPIDTTTGLSYSGYPSSGIGHAALLDNTGEDVHRTFTTQNSGTLYTAFLVKINSNSTGYFFHLSQNPPNISFYRARVFVGSDGSGDFEFGLSVGTTTPTLTDNNYTFGSVYLVVVKYELISGATNDRVSLFVFDSSIPTAEPATATIGPLTDASLTDPSGIGLIALRQHDVNQNVTIDGIRVGDAWSMAPGINYVLTLNTGGSGSGDITGSTANGTYPSGTPVTLVATATGGSTFAGWNPANCTNGFLLVADTTCTAIFTPPIIHYHLSVQTAGTGTGSISGDGSYVAGTPVILTATPNANSTFSGWNCTPAFTSGDPLTADTVCMATFETVAPVTHYHLSVQTTGTGTGSISGDGSYPAGTLVTLTAAPDAHSIFGGWSAGCSAKMMLIADTVCTAIFNAKTDTVSPPPPAPIVKPQPTIPKTMDLHVYLGGDGKGLITSQPGGIECHEEGRDCKHTYDTGTYIKLTATAAPGSTFWAWGGNDDCEDGYVSLYSNRYCTAYFHLLAQTLTVTRSGTGYGTVTTYPARIDCGTTCQAEFSPTTPVYLMATPGVDSTFIGYSGDEDCGDGIVTLNQAKTCHAIFEALPPSHIVTTPVMHTVTVSIQGQGHVTSTPAGIECGPVCGADFAHSTHVNLTAHAGDGFVFSHFSGDDDCAAGHFHLDHPRACVAHFTAPVLPPVTDVQTGTAAFVLSNHEIREGSGVLHVAAKRVGGSDGTLTVNYATHDGHVAKAGLDFQEARGTLTWDAGDVAEKTIALTLLDHAEISEEEVLEGEETFDLVLTDAHGEYLDKTMISLLHERVVVSPPPAVILPSPPAAVAPVISEENCPPAVKLDADCDANFQTVNDLEVTERGYLTNAVVDGILTNHGWVANLHIKSQAIVTGGIVTGYVENAGLIQDFTFRGRAIVGGTLSGIIHNNSVVGGYFQDVHLTAHTQISGGLLTGQISGDCRTPAVVENVRILRGSHLSCVELGANVILEENATVE